MRKIAGLRPAVMILAAVILLAAVWAPVSFAKTKDAAGEGDVITGFEPPDRMEYYYEGEPTEEELVKFLPGYLYVHLNGSDDGTRIPVRWEVVEDFADTYFYFYSLQPVWDEDLRLSEELDPLMAVPWITLFRKASEQEIKEGGQQPQIPVPDAEELQAIYTEEKGSIAPEGEEDKDKEDTNKEDSRDTGEAGPKAVLARLMQLCMEDSYAASASDTAKIYKYLTEKMGLNMAAACGVMTNLYAESGMLSNNLENRYNAIYGLSDKEYTKRVNKGKKNNGRYRSGKGTTRYFTKDYSGYGICQWTSLGRREKLLKSAVQKDVSIANLNMQLAFLKKELKDSYPQVWGTLQKVPNNAAGVYLSAAHFCTAFEVPANTTATSVSRAKTALSSYWKTYSGKSASASGKSYLGICGYTYPITVKKGEGVTVSGHVISNYKVKTVSTRITNEKGKTVYSSTRKPNTMIYSLYNFDGSMKFRMLGAGTYTYRISATDAHGRTVTVKHQFRVKKNGETETTRGCAVKDVSTTLR